MATVLYPASSTSSASKSNAVQSSAGAIAQGSKQAGFGTFSTAFKVGYTGTNMIFSPWLAYKAAKYEKNAMKMQADLHNMQAQSYHTAADDTWRAGMKQAAGIGYQAGQVKSSNRVAQAAAGIQVGASGSAAEVQAGIDIVKEIQINDVMAATVANAWGYRRAAVDETNQALAYEAAAKDISPWAAAITTMANDALSLMNSGGSGDSGGTTESGTGQKTKQPLQTNWQDFASLISSFKGMGSSSGGSAASMASSFGGK